MPMPLHNVRPAGNRHSCGDTSVGAAGRESRLPARDARGSGEAFPGDGAGGRLHSKRQVRWVLSPAADARNAGCGVPPAVRRHVNWPRPDARFGTGDMAFQNSREPAAGMGRAGQAGARAATAGLCAGVGRLPVSRRAPRSRPHGAVCARDGRRPGGAGTGRLRSIRQVRWTPRRPNRAGMSACRHRCTALGLVLVCERTAAGAPRYIEGRRTRVGSPGPHNHAARPAIVPDTAIQGRCAPVRESPGTPPDGYACPRGRAGSTGIS